MLVADPDPAVQAVLRIALEHRGYRARTAGTAAEAVAALQEPLYAVVTELVFPDRRGLEVVHAARTAGRTTAIIVLSEIGTDLSVIDALRAGAHDYVRKPFSPDELMARLERHGAPD